MKTVIALVFCFSALWAGAAASAPKNEAKKTPTAVKPSPKAKLQILCTPASHIAKEGELVKFAITSTSPGPLEVTISLDGSEEKIFKKVTVKSPAVVTASLPTPGFLHCLVRTKGAKCRRGVAVAPEKIRYARKAPADFKQFWASALAESKALPLDLKCKTIHPDPQYNSFLVSCANVNGKRAYALYAYPKNAKGKLPLQVMFGGGEAYWNKSCVPSGAKGATKRFGQDMAVLYLHLPPYEPADDRASARKKHQEFLKKLGLRRYILVGMEDPKQYYAYSAIFGCLRLLNAVAERPEIDKEKVVFYGASHGGKIGAFLARFFSFKAAFLGVPSSCEINAFKEGRYGSAAREWRVGDRWKTTDYFDLVYFAPDIKCPVLVGVGFHDRSCPPTGVYSFYNALPEGNKKIINKIHHGHGDVPEGYVAASWKFLADRIAPRGEK